MASTSDRDLGGNECARLAEALECERKERRRLEAALSESRERYRSAVEDSSQGILIHQNGRIVYANAATAAMFGYDRPEELLGFDLFQTLIAVEDHAALLERTAAFYRGEKRPPYPGFRGLRKDGSTLWVWANATSITWDNAPAIMAFYTDISEQRETERALRVSEDRFRTLVEHAPEAIVVFDADKGTFIDANENACRLFGMTLDELLRVGPAETSPLRQADGRLSSEAAPALVEAALAGKSLRFEWLHRHCKGDDIPCEIFLVRLPSETRRLTRGSIVDISERKRAERRERHRRDILERLATGQTLSTLLEAIVRMVESEAAGAVCSILLLDKTGKRLLHGAAPNLPEFYNQAVHGIEIGPAVGSCGTAAFRGQRVVVVDIENSPLWTPYLDFTRRAGLRSCWSEPIVSSAGRVLGTFAIYHAEPLTPPPEELESIAAAAHLASIAIERHQNEEALRDSEERLRLAASAAGFGAYDRDLITNERFWAPHLKAIYGLTPDEPITDEIILRTIHPDDLAHSQEALQASFDPAGNGEFSLQQRIVRPDGSIRWIDIRGRTLFEGEGAERRAVRAVGVASDITEQKTAEEERRKLETQIQHSQKLESLGVLAGGIAHDFNNLLTSILGYGDLARLALNPGTAPRQYIDEVIKGARRAADLTQQMLAYSGKGRFQVQPVHLSALVEEMARLLDVSISKKCVLKYTFAPDVPSCEADPSQLRQVIMNLIINASEAIGEDSGVIAVTVGTMSCDRDYLAETYLDADLAEGRYVFLEVADSGCGMSEETRAKVFDPFFTTKFTGRGLGLAAVLGIVRGHKGAIKVYSEVDRGTTFKVLFPASTAAALSTNSDEAEPTSWVGSGVVLVVDDEPSVRDLARKMLETMGFEVLTAGDGQEALRIFRQNADRIRLVLLDMTMPHLDGEETFRELRRIRSDVRTILSSGYNEQTATSRFVGKGLAGFIQKPYRYETLMEKVKDTLA